MEGETFYTIDDIAGMLGVERHLASRLVKSEMTYIQLSKRSVRVRKSDFESYLNRIARSPERRALP